MKELVPCEERSRCQCKCLGHTLQSTLGCHLENGTLCTHSQCQIVHACDEAASCVVIIHCGHTEVIPVLVSVSMGSAEWVPSVVMH